MLGRLDGTACACWPAPSAALTGGVWAGVCGTLAPCTPETLPGAGGVVPAPAAVARVLLLAVVPPTAVVVAPPVATTAGVPPPGEPPGVPPPLEPVGVELVDVVSAVVVEAALVDVELVEWLPVAVEVSVLVVDVVCVE